MKSKNKYKPTKIVVDGVEDIFTTHKLTISKAILKAIKYCHSKRIKSVDFAEVDFGGKITVFLSVNALEFKENIDKIIQILEEFEEYEMCAEALKLKQKMAKKKAKKEFVKS
jgi:hypothetical protein